MIKTINSYDVFDTLIGRLCYEPNLIFEIIQKKYNLDNIWMETNLMCMGEKASAVLNDIKWKKIFIFNFNYFFG